MWARGSKCFSVELNSSMFTRLIPRVPPPMENRAWGGAVMQRLKWRPRPDVNNENGSDFSSQGVVRILLAGKPGMTHRGEKKCGVLEHG
jgi:hypothetical protein